MSSVIVVLHRPQHPGNVGAVARTMANFGVNRLHLVAPECELDGVARARSKHARGLLAEAWIFDTLAEAVAPAGWVVATSGVGGLSEEGYLRHPLAPWELAAELQAKEAVGGLKGPLVLVFGPEDHGLSQEELALAEAVVTIPANQHYPILNLSHAVTVLLYELWRTGPGLTTGIPWRAEQAPGSTAEQRDLLVERYFEIAQRVRYREYKLLRLKSMLRRFIGRANPSLWDFHTLMGLATRIHYNLDLVPPEAYLDEEGAELAK